MSLLNTPIAIGTIELKNRLVMPPMATAKATEEGEVTPQLCEYYAEKSAGGYLGLILTEHSYVSLEGKAGKGQLSIADDHTIKGLTDLTRVIHKNGSLVMAQISHAGAAAKTEITGKRVLGASTAALPQTGHVPAEMTLEDIQKVIADFTAAAGSLRLYRRRHYPGGQYRGRPDFRTGRTRPVRHFRRLLRIYPPWCKRTGIFPGVDGSHQKSGLHPCHFDWRDYRGRSGRITLKRKQSRFDWRRTCYFKRFPLGKASDSRLLKSNRKRGSPPFTSDLPLFFLSVPYSCNIGSVKTGYNPPCRNKCLLSRSPQDFTSSHSGTSKRVRCARLRFFL